MSWQSTPLIPESLDHVLAHEASAPADPWTANPLQWGASPDVLDSAVTACRISGSARILAPAHRVSQEHVGALGGMFYNAASLRSSLQRGATRAVLRDLAHAAASLIATPRVRYMPDLALRLSAAFQAVGANALADKWAIIAHQWLMQRIMEPLHPRLVSVHAVAERAVTTALSRVCDARVQPCALALLEAGVDDGDDLIQLAQALEDGTHVATLPADDGDAAGQAVSPPVPAGDSVQSARLRSVVNSAPVRQPTAHCMHLDWLADAARDAALAGSVPGSRMCVGAGELHAHAALMPDAAVSAQSCADALRPLLATLEPAISALRESASAVDEAGVSPACSCGDAAGVSLFGAPAYVCAPAVLYNVSAVAARATPHGLLAELVAESGCADSVFGAPAAVAPWFAVDGASAHPTVMSLPNVLQRVSHASVVLSAMMQSSGDAGLAPKSSVFSRPRSMVTAAWAAVRATCAC
ncbi:MAG: hypothetical protein EOO41_03155 [Methanobacteriota archaeon]|nr:MAG: hypothetical protein EOO41_03155 [Euryarchaeota archaeon]